MRLRIEFLNVDCRPLMEEAAHIFELLKKLKQSGGSFPDCWIPGIR